MSYNQLYEYEMVGVGEWVWVWVIIIMQTRLKSDRLLSTFYCWVGAGELVKGGSSQALCDEDRAGRKRTMVSRDGVRPAGRG